MKTMMSVKTQKLIWEDDDTPMSLVVSTHPDNPDYVILTLENAKSGWVFTQMNLPLQVAKSFHMVLRDF